MRAPACALGLLFASGCGLAVEPSAPEAGPGASTGVAPDAEPAASWSEAPPPDAPPPQDDEAEVPLGHGAPYPVVLLHGMAGFVELGQGPFSSAYFAGVEPALRAAGEEQVYFTEVSPYASTAQRASELAPQLLAILQRTGAAKLNLIAHSQGGLDARRVISPAGHALGARVASLTTVSTPHHGTPAADLALRVLGGESPGLLAPAAEAIFGWLGQNVYDLDASQRTELRLQLLDLSPARSAQFNAEFVDDPAVRYQSYAGRTNLRRGESACAGARFDNPSEVDATALPLQATASYIEGNPLDPMVNDGLVPVQSARHGEFQQCVPADHLDQMGQGSVLGFKAPAFYTQVVHRLRAQGF